MFEKFNSLELKNTTKKVIIDHRYHDYIYTGEMKGCFYDGIGKVIDTKKKKINIGLWERDRFIKGMCYLANGSEKNILKTTYKDRKLVSHIAVLKTKEGIISNVMFNEYGEKTGSASVKYPNGDLLLCQFIDNQKHGPALYKKDSIWYEQYYIFDELMYQHKKHDDEKMFDPQSSFSSLIEERKDKEDEHKAE